ncbi:MAG: L-seryl-tRNA(Sec) selenium transferase [Planctomycetaceae bacterium]|nr:L-seryl-tRNA(Sec) selenium transferase [Planctomycetaceae bacterium]
MNVPSSQQLRLLPAVERVLNLPPLVSLCAQYGRGTVTGWVRQTLHDFRCGAAGPLSSIATEIEARVVQMVSELAEASTLQRLRKVINGTGVILHTNLGRAPLAPAAIEAMIEAAAATNLEVDLTTGRRGRRAAAVETLCREVTGAEAALVVNNCAAATLLTLQTLAAGRRVIISRGQLIEIGGSFRLPDVFQQAGVTLHEVGTTNRTRLADYAQAIGPESAALLRVHPSNYRISGFCESVAIAELAMLGKQHQLPAIDDVGSGCLYDLTGYGLPDEPIVRESLQAGADLVLFSGDKLLGGPQCGVIVGRADLVARLRSNPLARALRVDKVTLAALQATLEIHRAGRAFTDIPVLRQLSLAADELHARGTQLLGQLQAVTSHAEAFSLEAVMSAPGGGTLPDQTLPSWAVAVNSSNANELSQRLRLGTPAVFARVQEGLTLVDLRTVNPDDDSTLVRCLAESVAE